MAEKNKWVFWAFVLASLSIICVPSTLLVSTFQSYVSFLEGFEPGTVKPVKIRYIARRSRAKSAHEKPLRFVSFKIKAPRAKKVSLIGDFDAWKPAALPLWRQGRGSWEIILPLPSGSYGYLFVVDGTPTLDPRNGDSRTIDGRKASVKTVR